VHLEPLANNAAIRKRLLQILPQECRATGRVDLA